MLNCVGFLFWYTILVLDFIVFIGDTLQTLLAFLAFVTLFVWLCFVLFCLFFFALRCVTL